VSLLRPEKPLVSEAIDQESFTITRGSHASYRAALPLSSRTLTYVSGIIHRHRSAAGSRWRRLNPARQALLVLVYCAKARRSPSSPPGWGSVWTRPGYETVSLLAARAPKLRTAVRDISGSTMPLTIKRQPRTTAAANGSNRIAPRYLRLPGINDLTCQNGPY
jgi:hypothetical protein